MGHGSNILPVKGGAVPQDLGGAQKGVENTRVSPHENQPPKIAKENAPQLFDKKWHNAKADDLKNNLSNILSGGEKSASNKSNQARGGDENKHENARQTDQPKNQTLKQQTDQTKSLIDKSLTEPAKNLLNKQMPEPAKSLLNNSQTQAAKNPLNKLPPEPAKEILNKTWDALVDAAKEHKDLGTFRDKPKQFWNEVRQMSELRLVESFVGGKAEPRVVSRFGELLKQLERQGGGLQNFLSTLSPSERQVFQARYQLNQTFGASEFFAGKGIALDKRGDFPVRVFLSHNGKNIELPPHAILSLLSGGKADGSAQEFSVADLALLENHGLFTNGEVLLNSKSAALLGLSLALYQNIAVSLSLSDVAAETLLQNQLFGELLPKTPNAPVDQSAAKTANASGSENPKNSEIAARRAGEGNVAGALINGTFATIDKYRKGRYQPDGVSDKSNLGNPLFGFSAGATGAMMGATVGCIVPLAERSVGEILGFAASVVVGLTDSGLRALGVNTLVSVITTGAQIFLSASVASPQSAPGESAAKTLNAAPAGHFENELRQTILNRRRTTLLAS